MQKVASDKSEIVTQIPMACADERAAVEFLEAMRWNDSPACPRCGDLDVYQIQSRDGERSTRYLWRCRGCSRQYTVRIGTVMEESRIPLRHWCYAFWAACASKKGVSALQIKRQTGVTYKSALYLMHRIRHAMAGNGSGPLHGDVEVDETYVGGKRPRYRPEADEAYQKHTGRKYKPGRGADFEDRKTPVVALVSREGGARAYVPADVTGLNLKAVIRENVDPSATIHTDQLSGYRGIGSEFDGGHHTVNHSIKEYSRHEGERVVTTNTVEAFFALLKRGIVGTFHNVSKKHLHRYVAEFEFRWNTRKMDDGARIKALVAGAEGKRLVYRQPVG